MLSFTRKHRLLKAEQFNRVFKGGKKIYYKGLIVIAFKNDLNLPRLGFAISKKQVKLAVKRNLLKRVAKEVFRKQQFQLNGVDYIVLVNQACLKHNKQLLSLYFQKALQLSVQQWLT